MTKKYEGVPIRKLPDGESYSSNLVTTPSMRLKVYGYSWKSSYRSSPVKKRFPKSDWPHQRGVKQKRDSKGRFTS